MSIPPPPGQIASSSTSSMSEVESTLQRINQHPGVLGLIVTHGDGKGTRCLASSEDSPVMSGKDNYANYCTLLASQARSSIRDLDPLDDLKFMRVRTRKVEMMIAPVKEHTIICVQDPSVKK